jgi:hypothetical protein
MDPMYPAATFTATRQELLGDAPLLSGAEIARGVCRDVERTVSVLAVTPERMRRIDCWLGLVGFVAHAAAPDPDRTVVGSVCDRDQAQELLHSIVVSLVGPLPDAASAPVELVALEALSPGALPSGFDWVAVVTGAARSAAPERTVIAGADGLLIGDVTGLDRGGTLTPAGAGEFRAKLAAALALAPRSVRDLLIGD